MKLKTMAIFALLFGTSCKSQDLPTVPELNLERYQGTWYEIARLPNRFEKGLSCISATYTIREDGRVTVENRGVKAEGTESYIKGVAWVPNTDEPAKLKVRFFWPFAGNYWVIFLDENYQYALVGEPKRKYLWILSKTKTLDTQTFDKLKLIAKQKGFGVDKLIMVNQNCD